MPEERMNWENLRKIYEFESLRVSGPGSYRKDINDVLWTIAELQSALGLTSENLKETIKLIRWMQKQKHVLEVKIPDRESKYVTRTAETVRLLGHNYEYWYRGRRAIDSIRWLVDTKRIPTRDIYAEDFIQSLLATVSAEIGEDYTTFNLRRAIEMVIQGVASYLEPKDWKEAQFSEFQLETAKEMILSQFKPRYKNRVQILTAGVGTGKTIAFSIGMLVSAVEGILSGEDNRRTHLFLYPRKALAHDQYRKLRDIATHIGMNQLIVHFEHYSFYASEKLSVKDGIERAFGGLDPPPAIIITTLETLNRRLQHPLFISKLSRYLARVVIDEIHLIEGIPGCNIIRLLDRLSQACYPTELLWTGSSATVAAPDSHASTLFGIDRSDITVIEPDEEKLTTVGLVHHVFMRPSGRLSFLGTLVNSTTILLHNRRDRIWNRTRDKYPKTIGFADSLDLLGRWNSDLRENERTENARTRRHPSRPNPNGWERTQREVPYALRFHNPLQRRLEARGGQGEPYGTVLTEFIGHRLCDKCKSGERMVIKTCRIDEMRQLAAFVNRWPHEETDKVKIFHIQNPEIFEADSVQIGTLDLCPYLRAGACFWFSEDDLNAEQIIVEPAPRYEWRSVARSKIHSSKTKPAVELDDDLSELVFTATIQEVYDLSSEENIHTDIVLASPSLEVGVDLPNVTESIMFKAIRNVASYRQKAGRIGREEESDVINASLLSLRPVDLHYYRQPRKLISKAQLDPIPLKEHNDAILRCALYLGVWDYLALNADLPEAIPLNLSMNETDFTRRLKTARDYLRNMEDDVRSYLSRISRGRYKLNDSVIKEVIGQVLDEIGIFLTSTLGTIPDKRVSYVSDLIVNSLSQYGARIQPPSQSEGLKLLRWGEEEYEEYRPSINPIVFELSKEFQDLDSLSDSGWADLDRLRLIQDSIRKRLVSVENQDSSEVKKSFGALKRICDRALQDIIEGLEEMLASGQNPVVVYFYEQFENFRNEHPSWPYYLSYTVQGMPIFRIFKKHRSYTRPANLFTHPYEEQVTLYRRGQVANSIGLSEALFGFVPGTWTFRLGKIQSKTLVGRLESYQGGVLYASLDRLNEAGNEFDKIKAQIPAPPGFPSENLTIYMPTRLSIVDVPEKYVLVNGRRSTIIDGDEEPTQRHRVFAEDENNVSSSSLPRVKIPTSYLERWVHITADRGKRILLNELDEEFMLIEGEPHSRGSDARKRILHPMFDGIIRSINWHDNLEVYDFVYSVSRLYTSKTAPGATLMFRDRHGDIAIGRRFVTEGVSIELDHDTVDATVSRIKKEMLSHSSEWAPSSIKAFQASISSSRLADGTPVSPFMMSDLLGVLITSIAQRLDASTVYTLSDALKTVLADRNKFRDAAQDFYEGKYLLGAEEEETEFSESSVLEKQDLDRRIDELLEFASHLSGVMKDLEGELEDWIVNTLLNTFGVAALSTLQRLCGSDEEAIGYSVDLDGLKEGRFRVFLYDRSYYGNGSCEVLNRYLHILNIQRHGETDESRFLPSEDFLTLLEQELLQCSQFHTDMDALERLNQKIRNEEPIGLPELGYVSEYSDEVLHVCGDTWTSLGIKGRSDAWKLPIIALAPGSFAHLYGIEVDDVIRATTICWNGCPECVVSITGLSGSRSQIYVDKAVLDEWFRMGRKRVDEYKTVPVNDLATGESSVDIGRQSKVCLELPARKIRSISLPYTIGFELAKDGFLPNTQLIVRDDDIKGLRVFEERKGSAHGLESLGFKRIIWYNLMTSAYLDILGLLEEPRKEIVFVFYDCRDVTFDDIGISPRMMQAIEFHRRKSGLQGEIRKLSDVLIWLAERGFRVSICVDETRLQEAGVKEFLGSLSAGGAKNISIKTKSLKGLMHKKALITPLGIIQGSANLTYSGTGRNEEIINYAPFGIDEYQEMKLNVMDTFHGSREYVGIRIQ